MQITHDHSHVSQTEKEFIARGYTCESLYSLQFSYAFTEAQKAENRAYADKVGLGDAWNAHIASSAQRHSDHMERVAAVLAQNFSDWDLFFWCNDFSQTMQFHRTKNCQRIG